MAGAIPPTWCLDRGRLNYLFPLLTELTRSFVPRFLRLSLCPPFLFVSNPGRPGSNCVTASADILTKASGPTSTSRDKHRYVKIKHGFLLLYQFRIIQQNRPPIPRYLGGKVLLNKLEKRGEMSLLHYAAYTISTDFPLWLLLQIGPEFSNSLQVAECFILPDTIK